MLTQTSRKKKLRVRLLTIKGPLNQYVIATAGVGTTGLLPVWALNASLENSTQQLCLANVTNNIYCRAANEVHGLLIIPPFAGKISAWEC